MALGQCVQVANGTPYTFKQTSAHQYQMNQWGPFPDAIAPGAAPVTYYEFDFGQFDIGFDKDDDGADVTYSIDGSKSFTYHAGPMYKPVAELEGWAVTNGGSSFEIHPSPTIPCAGDNITYWLKINGSGDALSIVTTNVPQPENFKPRGGSVP